jgi:excisionase family DNA binding protein
MTSEILPPPSAAAQISAPVISLEALTYSVGETAQVLGVSAPTIYRLVARRLLRPLPGLRHKRIPKRQVLAYVNAGLPSL